ncbi:MAG: DNA recombination protein RmuC [Alphaproteobacteria bacterium]|nr:DNA recombination protein RmuC [Alphaproteobacteria bacterium]
MSQTLLPVITFAAGLFIGLGAAFLLRKIMSDHFRALSADALNATSEQFLKLAQQNFKALHAEDRGDMERRKMAIDEMLKPVQRNLEVLTGAVTQLKSTDEAVRTDLLNLQKETAKLAGAIHNPSERGRFGEYILKTLLDNSGLIEGQHYVSQASFSDAAGTSRPDFLIRIHDELCIAIDAKAPFIDLMDELDDDARHAEAAQKLATQVREHVKALARRDYTRLAGSADFTVLFLPGDHLYASVAKTDRDILDFAAKQRVLIASPMLLIGLLKVVVMMARQVDMARNAKRIAEVGNELHTRLKTFMDHFDKVGRALKSSVDAYNKSVGSMERMVMPKAREFEALKSLKDGEGLEAPAMLEATPRNAGIAELDEKAA